MHAFYIGVLSTVALVLSSAGLAGCGSEAQGDQVDSAEEAFSSQSCSTAGANRTWTGHAGETVSPRSYNNCTKSYVVDILNYDAAFTDSGASGVGGIPARINVGYADVAPTTPAACNDISVHAIFYKRVNGAWVDQTGPISQNLVWINAGGFSGCALGTDDVAFAGMVPGASYRVAATARVDSTGETRAVEIHSTAAVSIH